MIVQVRLFAVAKDLAGAELVSVEVAEPCTIGQLRAALGAQVPKLKSVLGQVTFAVDMQYAGDGTQLQPTSDVACIPPVSGG